MPLSNQVIEFNSIAALEDKKKFEGILKVLQNWAKDFGMKWSPLKTQRMVFRYQNCPESHPPFEMVFGGKVIEPLNFTSVSLGVIFDKNCTFTLHFIAALHCFIQNKKRLGLTYK